MAAIKRIVQMTDKNDGRFWRSMKILPFFMRRLVTRYAMIMIVDPTEPQQVAGPVGVAPDSPANPDAPRLNGL